MNSSSQRLVICGINYHTSTLEEREPFQIGADELAHATVQFASLPQIHEAAIISTCNRVEFCFVASRDTDPFETVSQFYTECRKVDVDPAREKFATWIASHAADHIFRVAAGIDSMVVGETQVFGQLKDAYGSACAVKSAGKVIHRIFHQAFRVGKQVRTDTEMGQGACSVSSAAVELLRTRFDTDQRPVILFVGVNQMIKLAATRCRRMHHSHYLFANRTESRAIDFATRFEGRGFGLDKLPELMTEADILISCTSSPEPVINADFLKKAAADRNRPLLVLDLAIPRDVAPADGIDPIEILDLDAIKEFVRTQRARREAAIPAAEEIVKQKLEEFNYWWRHVKEEPLYNGGADRLDAIVSDELTTLLDKCPAELREELNVAARRIARRSLQAGGRNQQVSTGDN